MIIQIHVGSVSGGTCRGDKKVFLKKTEIFWFYISIEKK